MNDFRLSNEFLDLITACQSQLFGYLYSLLHNMDDTEDVLQQTVLAMWRRFSEYDRTRSFVAWAKTFAKLSALNHLRAKRRDRVVFSDDLVLMLAESAAAETTEDALPSYHDALLRCMDQLPTSDRDLLELCYFEGCSITQAAAKIGRSPQSTCNSLRRIRSALFDCMTAPVPREETP